MLRIVARFLVTSLSIIQSELLLICALQSQWNSTSRCLSRAVNDDANSRIQSPFRCSVASLVRCTFVYAYAARTETAGIIKTSRFGIFAILLYYYTAHFGLTLSHCFSMRSNFTRMHFPCFVFWRPRSLNCFTLLSTVSLLPFASSCFR